MPVQFKNISQFDKAFYYKVFKRAQEIDSKIFTPSSILKEKTVGLIFFEASSRTLWSFHKACLDLGLKVMNVQVDSNSSLSKGESLEDSLELFFNLNFDLVVLRSKQIDSFNTVIQSRASSTSFVNAGFGSLEHPTQALLDYYTMHSTLSSDMSITDKDVFFAFKPKLLIIGDLKHSRVVRSHLRLAQILNYEVGLCPLNGYGLSPEELGLLNPAVSFESRKEAFDWADVVMPLRAQKERFGKGDQAQFSPMPVKSSELKKDQWLMHPGPVVWGEDIDYGLMRYSKSLISLQQKSGVTCRAALMSLILEEDH